MCVAEPFTACQSTSINRTITFRHERAMISVLHRVQTGSGGPPSLRSNRNGGAFTPGVKRPGREANHSPQSSAEVENPWSHTSTPPIRLYDVVLN
jgi:hypothetical protein